MQPFGQGLLVCYFATLLVLFGVILGGTYFHGPSSALPPARPFPDSLALWDGWWYLRIVQEGYQHDPAGPSSVAFFPAYPLCAAALSHVTEMSPVHALVLVAHLFLAATLLACSSVLLTVCAALFASGYRFI